MIPQQLVQDLSVICIAAQVQMHQHRSVYQTRLKGYLLKRFFAERTGPKHASLFGKLDSLSFGLHLDRVGRSVSFELGFELSGGRGQGGELGKEVGAFGL